MPGRKKVENDLFHALGHPMRRRILREMLDSGREVSPRELAAKLREGLCALSHHVRVLAECRAIELVRTEQVGGLTKHFYRAAIKADWVLAALKAGRGTTAPIQLSEPLHRPPHVPRGDGRDA